VEIGVSETTVRRWRARGSVHERPHTSHRLATTLTPMQEYVVVEWRKLLLLPLDDLLVVALACRRISIRASGVGQRSGRPGTVAIPADDDS
jgi:hypothetical protein